MPRCSISPLKGTPPRFISWSPALISVRTRDEVSLPTAIRLFEAAPTAQAISRMSTAKIAALIRPASFYETKASNIRELAQRVVEEYGGKLPV